MKKNILIPELVPLKNKGEEAIVRGIGDVIFGNGKYELHLFDDVDSYYFKDDIHVYPVKWFMSPWLNYEFGLGFSTEKIKHSFFSVIRNILHKIKPDWVTRKEANLIKTFLDLNSCYDKEKQGLLNLSKVEYIVGGHDGAMDERVCHVIDEFQKYKYVPFGVFGVEFPQKFKSHYIVSEQKKVLKKAQFFYCRTQASFNVVKKYFPEIKAEVKPDPAFGMIPVKGEVVDDYLKSTQIECIFKKPVVVCTTCETGPIARHCFQSSNSPDLKLSAHRNFFASLIDYIVEKYDVNVLFLPHALGPGKALDDTYVAEEIIKKTTNKDSLFLLKDDISAKLLKGIISKADFLIAERIHSMIGAVGVATPFMCLGSNTDRRIKGIISEMCESKEVIFYLNNPCIEDCKLKFDFLWQNANSEKQRLSEVSSKLFSEHSKASSFIKQEFSCE